MAKTKSRKFHKIKIHHNRWLIWAIAYVVFVGIALTGYLKIANISLDSENSGQNIFVAAHSYSAPSLGFTLRYPADWSIESDSTTSVTFLPTDGAESGVTVSVMAPSAEKSIRKTLKVSEESRTTVDGISAAKITNDLGNGYTETVVMAISNHLLYVVRGSDNFVQNLLVTFHFLPLSK